MILIKCAGSMVGVALMLTGMSAGVVGQEPVDSRPRNELHRADLAEAPTLETIVSTAEYAPGDSIGRHYHHGLEALYVVQGAMIQAPGKEPRDIPTGTSLLYERDVIHGGFTVVGDSVLKLFTVHVVDKGKPLYEYVE
jgi:quercetin dioxygenase-like cupin family protein